jgi:excisionase family DNA binding protein
MAGYAAILWSFDLMAIQRELLSVREVATALGCSERSVYRMRNEGRLPPVIKLGGLTKWRAADISRFAANGCRVPESV